MSNANKFTQCGTITVSAKYIGDSIAIAVNDTGIGMLDVKVADILNTTNPLTTAGTRNEKGNGLGLMLVKQFIEQLNGKLTIESQMGIGSCFKVTI